jgi:hypothetical protein
MYFRSKLFRAVSVVSLVVSLTGFSFADTIRLKDGGIIKGRIVNFSNGTFTVAVGDGTRRREMSFDAGDIESIQFDTPQQVAQRSLNISRPVSTAPQSARTEDTTAEVVEDDTETAKPADTAARPSQMPAATGPVSNAKPVSLSVKVRADNANNGWTNSGWVVRKGQRIHITGDGEVSLGSGGAVTPSGTSAADSEKLMKNAPTGALIAVIGDDNNDFIWVGTDREFTA